MPILEVKNLSVEIAGSKLLDEISFSVEKGDAVAVVGPNGAGKTTLFRALIGALPYKGEINFLKGIRIGYVPQKIDLERDLPITIEEFFRLKSARGEKISDDEINKALFEVHLTKDYAKKGISALSSGEFQRTLIAWAILGHPNLLLFDEPTASIDIAGQETIYELLHELQDKHELTLILISHDLSVVYRYTNKVLCINKKQICYGAPQDVLTPSELNKLYGGERTYYHHLH
ncbi:metal ABC transporter ATP-binding protein [Candidatus Giovannonibacteria bacterium]|nr:metal ABC transporter ATP-binding protein [Candidatus Giovannonibacteria bacterium]